jgi:hypothetical protein
VVLVGFDCLEAVIVHAIWPHAGARSGDGVELMNIRVISAFSFMSFIALIPFFGIMELSRMLGEDQMRKLFFHKHAKPTLVTSNP